MNKKIELLHPVLRSQAQALYEEANRRLTGRAKMLITDTLRTFAYQDWLYAKGRTQPGKKVTNARGGQSLHNYGLAIDFALLIEFQFLMVQLKAETDGYYLYATVISIPYGSIKRFFRLIRLLYPIFFQFLMVQLKDKRIRFQSVLYGFQFLMVQLKAYLVAPY